jgi:hypothetical protein
MQTFEQITKAINAGKRISFCIVGGHLVIQLNEIKKYIPLRREHYTDVKISNCIKKLLLENGL